MKTRKLIHSLFLALLAGIIFSTAVIAQPAKLPTSLSREDMIYYTAYWKGERFPDGRPKVSDDLVRRMKHISVTEAWQILNGTRDGELDLGTLSFGETRFGTYSNQYSPDWVMMREEVVVCGRASTIHFLPYRPDLNTLIQEQGTKIDERGRGQYTWGIDQLQEGDVYVANVCEGILDASHVGDNLGTAIWTKTGNGAIIRGTLRDLYGNLGIDPKWNVMVRDFRPQANSSNLVIGINCPIQIGYVTVMPGDIVIGSREGVVFVPPHHAQRVVETSERTRLQDKFAHAGLREGRWTAREADGAFTPAMHEEFTQWLIKNADNMKKFFPNEPDAAPSPEFIRAYAKERQSK